MATRESCIENVISHFNDSIKDLSFQSATLILDDGGFICSGTKETVSKDFETWLDKFLAQSTIRVVVDGVQAIEGEMVFVARVVDFYFGSMGGFSFGYTFKYQ